MTQIRGILHIDLSARYGGADVRVTQLAEALSEHHRCSVVCIEGSGLHERLREMRVNHVPLSSGRGDPLTGHAIAQLLRSGRFNVVDAHNPQSQLWGALAAAATRTPGLVLTAHSQYRQEHGHRSVRGHAYESVLRLGRRLGARFVAVSDATGEYLRGLGIDPDRVAVIPNAIGAQPPVPPAEDVVPATWPPDRLVLGTVGRLEPVKGLTDLLDALATVRAEGIDAGLVMVGEGRERAALESQVRELGLSDAVAFAGFRKDVDAVLPALDVFCQPSHSEGLPFALLEAAASARAVLVTAVGEVPGVVPDGGGIVVAPGDPAALADGLRRLASSPEVRLRMGTALRESVGARFSIEALTEGTLAVYEAAIAGRPVAAG